METNWIQTEILRGFQRLACLGLERTPAAEVLPLTAAVWLEAVTAGRVFDEARDVPRFRQAFAALCAGRRSWPAPQDFIEALPRVEVRAIAYEVKAADPARARAALAAIAESLAIKAVA